MQINFNHNIRFGSYRAPIKTLFKEGAFGERVTRGFYGEHITLNNVSLEHLKPHAKGGRNAWNNLVLAANWKNKERGLKPLREFIKPDKASAYLEQFRGIVIPGKFNGNDYIRMIKKTLHEMKIFIDSFDIERRIKSKPYKKSPRCRFR